MIRSTIYTALATLCLIASLCGKTEPLQKSLPVLNDFYQTCLQFKTVEFAKSADTPSEFIPSIYRDAIQYEIIADTIWVKVFITTGKLDSQFARKQLKDKNVRSLSQFGNIFAAKIDLMQLPELDGLAFVQRIEPVVPDGVAARASLTGNSNQLTVKKK